MKIKLNRKIFLDGVQFQKGTNEIDDSFSNHWFIQALIADGDAIQIGSISVSMDNDQEEKKEKRAKK